MEVEDSDRHHELQGCVSLMATRIDGVGLLGRVICEVEKSQLQKVHQCTLLMLPLHRGQEVADAWPGLEWWTIVVSLISCTLYQS